MVQLVTAVQTRYMPQFETAHLATPRDVGITAYVIYRTPLLTGSDGKPAVQFTHRDKEVFTYYQKGVPDQLYVNQLEIENATDDAPAYHNVIVHDRNKEYLATDVRPDTRPLIYQKQPWEMTLHEFSHPVPIAPTKPGYRLLYHRTGSAANAPAIVASGLLVSKTNTQAELPNAIWATNTPTGYSTQGTLIVFQVAEDDPGIEYVTGGGSQAIIHHDIPAEDILDVDYVPDLTINAGQRLSSLRDNPYAAAYHHAIVVQALSEGKPVPATVLADYPDLAPDTRALIDSVLIGKREVAPWDEWPVPPNPVAYAASRGLKLTYRFVSNRDEAVAILKGIVAGNPAEGFMAATVRGGQSSGTKNRVIDTAERRGAVPVFTTPYPTVAQSYFDYNPRMPVNLPGVGMVFPGHNTEDEKRWGEKSAIIAILFEPSGLIYQSSRTGQTQSYAYSATFPDAEYVIDARKVKEVYVLSPEQIDMLREYVDIFTNGYTRGAYANSFRDKDPDAMKRQLENSMNLRPIVSLGRPFSESPLVLSNGVAVMAGDRVALADGQIVTLKSVRHLGQWGSKALKEGDGPLYFEVSGYKRWLQIDEHYYKPDPGNMPADWVIAVVPKGTRLTKDMRDEYARLGRPIVLQSVRDSLREAQQWVKDSTSDEQRERHVERVARLRDWLTRLESGEQIPEARGMTDDMPIVGTREEADEELRATFRRAIERDIEQGNIKPEELSREQAVLMYEQGPEVYPLAVSTPEELADKWANRRPNSALLTRDLASLDEDRYDISEVEDLISEYQGLERSDYASQEEYSEERAAAWEAVIEALGNIEEIESDDEPEPDRPLTFMEQQRLKYGNRSVRGETLGLPGMLMPLAQEAAKYDTFEEFERAFQIQLKHGRYYHITDNPNFTIDPRIGPRDMSSMADGGMEPGKLMITSHLENWLPEYPNRKYVAIIDMSDVPPDKYWQSGRGFGNEFWVDDPSQARVIRVVGLPAAKADARRYHNALEKYINGPEDLRRLYDAVKAQELPHGAVRIGDFEGISAMGSTIQAIDGIDSKIANMDKLLADFDQRVTACGCQLAEPGFLDTHDARALSITEREVLARQIAEKTRQPLMNIVPVYKLKGSDGNWYSASGFPSNVSYAGERRIDHYAFADKNGITHGTGAATEAELIKRNQEYQDRNVKEGYKAFLERDDKGLQEAADFWLGEPKTPQPPPVHSTPAPRKPAIPKSLGTGSAEDDERLADLRRKLATGRSMGYGAERSLERLERMAKSDPSKWHVGDGVGYHVSRQINRGFRIVRVDPATKLALLRQVADTGLTSTGGDYDRIAQQWWHIADLVRDRRYDAPDARGEYADDTPLPGASWDLGPVVPFDRIRVSAWLDVNGDAHEAFPYHYKHAVDIMKREGFVFDAWDLKDVQVTFQHVTGTIRVMKFNESLGVDIVNEPTIPQIIALERVLKGFGEYQVTFIYVDPSTHDVWTQGAEKSRLLERLGVEQQARVRPDTADDIALLIDAMPLYTAEPSGDIKSEPGYLYHASNRYNAFDIASEGIVTHRPSFGTDQSTWPDGSRQKRSYFSRNAGNVWWFAPEDGKPVILRTRDDGKSFWNESTGDVYTTKRIPPERLEILMDDGRWISMAEFAALDPWGTEVEGSTIHEQTDAPTALGIREVEGNRGVVYDQAAATGQPCTRVKLPDGSTCVFQRGIIGALDDAQQAAYCQLGYTDSEASAEQIARISETYKTKGVTPA